MSEWITPQNLVLAAGACFVAGYLVINQMLLRLLLFMGSALYLWYYFVAAEQPLWDAIAMSALMLAANIVGFIGLWLQHSVWIIPKKHRDLYDRFNALPPGDFKDLMNQAYREHYETEVQITQEGAAVDRLYYVITGALSIEKQGERFRMPAGVFVGEVAYMTGMKSSASTWLSAGSDVLVWDVQNLRRRSERKARFKLALEAMLSKDLAMKVAYAVAPAATQTPEAIAARERSA